MNDIERLQRMKTGALLIGCCQAGAILGGADEEARRAIERYGRAVGFAFQLADDLLDVEGDAAEIGKAVGKDAAKNKATFVSLMGPRPRDENSKSSSTTQSGRYARSERGPNG